MENMVSTLAIFRSFTVEWTLGEEFELVRAIILYVLLLLYHKNMYWYV